MTVSSYPPLNVQVHTPRLSLLGATDDLMERLVPAVRKGVATAATWPFDVDGEPVGMQDLIGTDFAAFGTVSTFSWLSTGARGGGLGKEMRQAVLHLAFEGLGARQADSEAFFDNHASNRVSQAVGYLPNGLAWSTRRGEAA